LFGLSETVPGQGITPKEVLDRYVNRKSLPVMDGVYTDNHLLPDNYERMDKVERVELAYYMHSLIADRRARMQARRNRPRVSDLPRNSSSFLLTPWLFGVRPSCPLGRTQSRCGAWLNLRLGGMVAVKYLDCNFERHDAWQKFFAPHICLVGVFGPLK